MGCFQVYGEAGRALQKWDNGAELEAAALPVRRSQPAEVLAPLPVHFVFRFAKAAQFLLLDADEVAHKFAPQAVHQGVISLKRLQRFAQRCGQLVVAGVIRRGAGWRRSEASCRERVSLVV